MHVTVIHVVGETVCCNVLFKVLHGKRERRVRRGSDDADAPRRAVVTSAFAFCRSSLIVGVEMARFEPFCLTCC
jgi:hypothetical protein